MPILLPWLLICLTYYNSFIFADEEADEEADDCVQEILRQEGESATEAGRPFYYLYLTLVDLNHTLMLFLLQIARGASSKLILWYFLLKLGIESACFCIIRDMPTLIDEMLAHRIVIELMLVFARFLTFRKDTRHTSVCLRASDLNSSIQATCGRKNPPKQTT